LKELHTVDNFSLAHSLVQPIIVVADFYGDNKLLAFEVFFSFLTVDVTEQNY